MITPPFQAPDEPSHFAYVQLLAETGKLPSSSADDWSQEEETVVTALDQSGIEWHPEVHTISSPSAQRILQEDLTLPLRRVGKGGAGVAASEPPLYYALEAIPYFLGAGGTLLDRLELMRLLSALMAGVTALFVFLFVRESLPKVPWAWTVGGLAAALAPPLGFTSGAVTPDALLFAVSAASFYVLARAFRHGLTRRRAVAIGLVTAIGFLTKLNFLGLAPGVMLGLVILAFRGVGHGSGEGRTQRAFGNMVLAMAIAISPICVYVLSNALDHHHLLGLVSSGINGENRHGSIFSEVSYIWEFYLPRLPGMVKYFPGLSTIRYLWFDRAVGLYGWLDTSFPTSVENLALIPAGLIAILSLRALLGSRAALRARLPEILVYLVMSVGVMVLLGQDSHLHGGVEGAGWAQPRYLMPMLPLAAALFALAARGAGKRWGPAVGVLIVTLFLAQDIFSQLLVVSRFYG
jgi:4-amino-4-deoxy-L-arabinose transferase-like glycosyltransferase